MFKRGQETVGYFVIGGSVFLTAIPLYGCVCVFIPMINRQTSYHKLVNPNLTLQLGNHVLPYTHKYVLTHWGRVMHICVSELTIIGSDNGLSPGRRQAIIWTIAGILWIGPLGTNFSEILIEIYTFSFRKCIWKCRLENGGHFVSASMCQEALVFNHLPSTCDHRGRRPVLICDWITNIRLISR